MCPPPLTTIHLLTPPQAEDPVTQSTLFLRLLGPGYNSLPNFTLADNVLSTTMPGPHGIGVVTYNSSTVAAGKELVFEAKAQEGGNLGLEDGYLVSVGGEAEGKGEREV